MAIPTHLNSCSSVWKRRAHTELVGGPQAWPQPMYSSGVWCLVTTGVWEVGGLPPLETLEWQNTRTLTGFQKWRAPSKSTPTAPYFSSSQTERASESAASLVNASRVFEPAALAWSQSFAVPEVILVLKPGAHIVDTTLSF